MASLTPKHRSDEVTGDAMYEGLINGTMVLFPCMAGLYAGLQNPSFRKVSHISQQTHTKMHGQTPA
jgi:hypothetical protein